MYNMKTNHTSYGIIPIYRKDDEIFICCVHNEKSNEWGLPKGTPEENETPFETAKRELLEETGIHEFEIFGGKYFSEKYTFSQDGIEHHKQNIYLLAIVSEMIEKPERLDSKDMKWININDSNEFFKFDGIKKILAEVSDYLKKFPLVTEYDGKSGEQYLFEYYNADFIFHLPKDQMSQVQIMAFHNDKLLIVNNSNKFNLYSPVGGGIEKGEHPEDCLIRELKEESNMSPIEFKLIGYQKCSTLSDPQKPIQYQLRYFAIVEPIGPFTPECDPDGDVTELLEIDPVEYKKYFDWGDTSDCIINRAKEFYNHYSKI
jgi:bis(5'-nucleosidyl)-tetraphosphatase